MRPDEVNDLIIRYKQLKDCRRMFLDEVNLFLGNNIQTKIIDSLTGEICLIEHKLRMQYK